MTHVHPKVKWKCLTKSYSFWVKPCTLIFCFAFNFLWRGHFCSYKSWAALKQWFDLPCPSLPHKSLSVINIIPSDCGASNGIPCPKITPQKWLCVHIWTELLGRKVQMTLASAHNVRYRSPGHQEQDKPSRTQTTFLFLMSTPVKPMSEAVLKPPAPPFHIRKSTVPSSLLAWQARPAVHRCAPSQQHQGQAHSRTDALGLSLASSHQ